MLWCGSKNQPPVSEAHTPWRRIWAIAVTPWSRRRCAHLLLGPSWGRLPGPCPAWRPLRAPGPGLALTPWSPQRGERSEGRGCEQGRGRPGSQRCGRPRRGWSRIRGVRPHPRPRTDSEGRAGRQGAGHGPGTRRRHPKVAWGGCPGVQRPLPRFRLGKPRDPRSTSGVTGHSLWAPRLCPASAGAAPRGRPEEGAASRQPAVAHAPNEPSWDPERKTWRLECASAGGWSDKKREDLSLAQSPGLREGDGPKGKALWAHAHLVPRLA